MKKIKYLLVLTTLLFLIPNVASAKTLGQLKAEYNKLEEQYSSKNKEIKYTEAEISSAKNRITEIYKELDEAEKEIQSITNEITKLNESIEEKDKQTKELIKFFQLSQGESTYLEYIFSADSITDFIYRVSVTEQLSKYNDKLIDDMHKLIDQNNKNIANLHSKEDSLKKLQNELNEKLVVLASERETLYDESQSIEDDIKTSKSILDFYTKAGCKDNEEVSSCGAAQLPPGTKFWRPITAGCITSNYGGRIHPIYGYYKIHSGIDMSCGDRLIYSITDGKVKATGYNSSMGNYIVIHHNVNGNKYSSVYMHLASIYVKSGDIVTKDTNIGYMGTTGASTGTHLHLTMYTGLYLEPGAYYSMVNPRDYINFPSFDDVHYSYFYNRTTYYN